MKNWLAFALLATSAATGLNALAESTDCSNYDSTMTFHAERDDTVASGKATRSLKLYGETLMDDSATPKVETAVIARASHPVWSNTTTAGNYRTTVQLGEFKITSKTDPDSAPLFDDLAFCRDVIYVGPPVSGTAN